MSRKVLEPVELAQANWDFLEAFDDSTQVEIKLEYENDIDMKNVYEVRPDLIVRAFTA